MLLQLPTHNTEYILNEWLLKIAKILPLLHFWKFLPKIFQTNGIFDLISET